MSVTRSTLTEAFAAHQHCNLAVAEKTSRATLRTQPDDPDLLYLFAMPCLDTEQLGMAAGYVPRALNAAGGHQQPNYRSSAGHRMRYGSGAAPLLAGLAESLADGTNGAG